MYTSYLACDLGTEQGRVSLGTLDKGRLNVSTLRRFNNTPTREDDCVQWNIPELSAGQCLVGGGLHVV